MLSEIEHTVEPGAHAYAPGIVMSCSKISEILAIHRFNLLCFRIINLLVLSEEPVHSVGNGRSDIDIFQQSEIRKSYLEIMRHTTLEFIGKPRFHEL